MGATQTDNESGMGKWKFITVCILGIALFIALLWSLPRVLNHDSVAPANEDTAMNTVLSQEEIDRHDAAERQAEQGLAPVAPAPVAVQPAVSPTKQAEDAVILQKAKTKVNQLIIDRMKQYVRDNPNHDNRKIEEQIKKRENQDAQNQ